MTMINKKVVLSAPLDGVPTPENFEIIDEPMPEPGMGEFLVRHIYLSLDPYQRIAMAGRHMSADGKLATGASPRAETVGQVTASRHSDFHEGDYVRSFGGWQEFSISEGTGVFKIDPAAAPLSAYLGVLGMPGLTAYASVVKLANIRPGQTVLVSAASGPVGGTLGQIAMQRGGKAVGIAGGAEKCAWVSNELGFDACIDYKKDGYKQALQAAVPDGVDIYHDNVGGQILDNAFSVLKNYGTVILCGLISQMNDKGKPQGLYLGLPIVKRAVMKGLVVYDFEDQRDEFFDLVAPWVKSGKVKFKEDRAVGIDATPAQFSKLMAGGNFGKTLVVLGPETA